MNKKSIITKNIIENTVFAYQKDDITLNFTLRSDNSSNMRKFRDILKEATRDVELIIKGMKN